MSLTINLIFLVLLLIAAIGVLKVRQLLAMVMLFGVYSFLVAGLFVVLDAPDVAFTEAAVGTGISTVLMLVTLAAVRQSKEAKPTKSSLGPLVMSIAMGALLIYGMQDIAEIGDPKSPVNQQVGRYYIEKGQAETGVPNLVTAVLASYRGFDTLGEVTVVLTAGIGVLMILRREKIRVKAQGNEK